MQTYANQDIVEVQKEPCDKDNIYMVINQEAVRLAVKDLTPA